MNKITYLALIASSLPMAAMAGGMAQPIVEPMIVVPAAPVMMMGRDWTGAYAGTTLGFGKFRASGGNTDGNQGIVGLNAGYRYDFGSMVLGGELGYSKNDIGIKGGDNQINSTFSAALSLGADLGQTLVYVAGGASRANAEIGGVKGTDSGYFAGIGADYALNDQWTIGGEVIASKYNDFKNSGINLNDTSLVMKVDYNF
jgi:outer membrane immunogenic protein